jgi:methylglutaconyl-CoA hydratase
MPTALLWAQTISANAPLAVKAAKKALLFSCRQKMKEGLAYELKAYDEIIHTKDRIEGLMAFKEKRKAVFQGK